MFSTKKAVAGSAGALAGLALIGCLLLGVFRTALCLNLERTKAELDRLTPLASELSAARAAADSNQKMLFEFRSWSSIGRSPMYDILRAVQENIPAQMLLYHFSAGVESTGETEASACTLYLSGTARGELTVVEGKRQLNSDSRLRSFCGEIKLISSQRDFGEDWAFAFEGCRFPGGSGE